MILIYFPLLSFVFLLAALFVLFKYGLKVKFNPVTLVGIIFVGGLLSTVVRNSWINLAIFVALSSIAYKKKFLFNNNQLMVTALVTVAVQLLSGLVFVLLLTR